MPARSGERRKPLPARDSKGRFVSSEMDLLLTWVCGPPPELPARYSPPAPPAPPSMEVLLWRFDLAGECRFPDPWREDGWYVVETRRSLKGYPVAMHYEGALIDDEDLREKDEYGYENNCVIKYDNASWANCPAGEVAVSPAPWHGHPSDRWEGHWNEKENKRQLARLYIHLAHSVDLHTKTCGEAIGSYSSNYDD